MRGGGDTDCHSQCAHWLRNDRVSMECGAWQAGDREGRPYRRLLMVPCAAGHMGPALQGVFVGQGPRALPGVRYKVGGWGL